MNVGNDGTTFGGDPDTVVPPTFLRWKNPYDAPKADVVVTEIWLAYDPIDERENAWEFFAACQRIS